VADGVLTPGGIAGGGGERQRLGAGDERQAAGGEPFSRDRGRGGGVHAPVGVDQQHAGGEAASDVARWGGERGADLDDPAAAGEAVCLGEGGERDGGVLRSRMDVRAGRAQHPAQAGRVVEVRETP
jgi:hypothetical protein